MPQWDLFIICAIYFCIDILYSYAWGTDFLILTGVVSIKTTSGFSKEGPRITTFDNSGIIICV